MPEIPGVVIGIAWYKPADWPRIREIREDAAYNLPSTFEAWLEGAERAVNTLHNMGLIPVKVEIDPDLFVAWCRYRGYHVDAVACTQYANERAGDLGAP